MAFGKSLTQNTNGLAYMGKEYKMLIVINVRRLKLQCTVIYSLIYLESLLTAWIYKDVILESSVDFCWMMPASPKRFDLFINRNESIS